MVRDGPWPAETGIFLLWGFACTVGLLAVLAILSIGVFVLPFAWLSLGVTLWLTFRRSGRAFTMVGALLGPAFWLSFMGATWAARSYSPDGSRSSLDPARFAPYLGVTVCCVAAAVALFVGLGLRTHKQQARNRGR